MSALLRAASASPIGHAEPRTKPMSGLPLSMEGVAQTARGPPVLSDLDNAAREQVGHPTAARGTEINPERAALGLEGARAPVWPWSQRARPPALGPVGQGDRLALVSPIGVLQVREIASRGNGCHILTTPRANATASMRGGRRKHRGTTEERYGR
jgi:hypothetical protein